MKIIKEGKIPSPIYKGTCLNCSTEVECELFETQPSLFIFKTVYCPTCGTIIWVSTK